ncbi:hypothetical protein ABPG75_000352 [Micractinium tetrahymenae]
MRVQLLADPSRAQCTFKQMQQSGMVTRLEGVNAAVPLRLPRCVSLSAGEHCPQLEEELRQATERFLCSIGVTFNIFAEAEEEPTQQCSIVIMHQKVKLRFVPPGVGRLLVGHLMSTHLQSLKDVMAHFSAAQKDASTPK